MPCKTCKRSHHRCKCYRSELVEDVSRKCKKKPSPPRPPTNNELPFVEKDGFIRYNTDRGVKFTDPTVLGSSTPAEYAGVKGYRPTHLTFDPSNGTLTSGTDVNNGWVEVGRDSIITGLGNQAELDSSFVSGTRNKILKPTSPDLVCVDPPSNAIVGGSGNRIQNTTTCRDSSAIIASDNVNLIDSSNVAVIGISLPAGNTGGYRNFTNAILTDNVYSVNGITTGPISNTKRIPPTVPTAPVTLARSTDESSKTLDPQVWTGDVAGNTLYGNAGVYGSSLWAGTSTPAGWVPGPVYADSVESAKVSTDMVKVAAINSDNLEIGVSGNELTKIAGVRDVTSSTNRFRTGEDFEDVIGSRLQSIGEDRISTIGNNEVVTVKNDSVLKTGGNRTMSVDGQLEVTASNLRHQIQNDDTIVIGDNRSVESRSTLIKVHQNAVDEIGGDRICTIQGTRHVTVQQDQVTEIGSNDVVMVGSDASLQTKGNRILDVVGDVISNVAGRAAWTIIGKSELECDHLIDRVKTRSDIFSPITEFYGDIKSQAAVSSRSIYGSTTLVTSPDGSNSQLVVTPSGTSSYNLAPLNSNINVIIDSTSAEFEEGYYLTFKDVTLSYAPGTTYNIFVTTNNNVAIQYRDEFGQLQIAQNGTYTLRTSGASVSFRYTNDVSGGIPTWNIISEVVGQLRQ
jgi:hypothetical protein